MKKIILTIIMFLICSTAVYSTEDCGYTLKAGVSVIEQVPNSFYGNWRVVSKLLNTNSPANFKASTIDLWNLSREGDVINLNNPFTGAAATLTLHSASAESVKFMRVGQEGNQKLTDIVELKLGKDTFTGTNILYLQTISDINGEVISTKSAKYSLRGERISGMSILGK